MKIIFAGTPANAAETLRALAKSNHEIVAVLTRQDAEVGRKRILTESAVASVAAELGVRVIKANMLTTEVVEIITGLQADLGVVVAYGSIFKLEMLNATADGWLNIHYSLLPKWRGAAPVQRAILAGDTETGVTLFKLDEGMDTGPMLKTVATKIEPAETAADLLHRLTLLGITALDETLALIESGLAKATPQSSTDASIASKLTHDEARIDWAMSSQEIDRAVRAFNPEPMAWTLLQGQNFRVIEARPTSIDLAAAPGFVVANRDAVSVACGGKSSLQLITVQPAGKSIMDAAAWANGARNLISESLYLG